MNTIKQTSIKELVQKFLNSLVYFGMQLKKVQESKKIETNTKELYNIPTFIREAHQFYGEWVSLQFVFAECTNKMF